MVYGCLCTVCKGRARWNLRDYDASSLRPRSGPPLLPLLKIVPRPCRNVPELEIRIPEQDSVPNGAVVAVSIDGQHRFSKISRLSITLTRGHGIDGDAHLSCGTDTWRGAIQRRPTSGRSTSSRANYSMRSRLPDSKCAPEISARTSLRSGSISNASPLARCCGLALQRRSNLPASARPASSSIASSPDGRIACRADRRGHASRPASWRS
jgi:hypothetical protein